MKVPILGLTVDERFLTHRLRSTSIGGLSAVLVAAAMFFNDLFHHVIRWDLFAIIATAAVVKISVLTWYRMTD
jgi:hypothetical protein